ncbi:MAG: hypothetical protein AAF434_01105 [Pseudomonadota bacterium]
MTKSGRSGQTILFLFVLSLSKYDHGRYGPSTACFAQAQIRFIHDLRALLAFGINQSKDTISNVIPAQAGIHKDRWSLDPRLRGDDDVRSLRANDLITVRAELVEVRAWQVRPFDSSLRENLGDGQSCGRLNGRFGLPLRPRWLSRVTKCVGHVTCKHTPSCITVITEG